MKRGVAIGLGCAAVAVLIVLALGVGYSFGNKRTTPIHHVDDTEDEQLTGDGEIADTGQAFDALKQTAAMSPTEVIQEIRKELDKERQGGCDEVRFRSFFTVDAQNRFTGIKGGFIGELLWVDAKSKYLNLQEKIVGSTAYVDCVEEYRTGGGQILRTQVRFTLFQVDGEWKVNDKETSRLISESPVKNKTFNTIPASATTQDPLMQAADVTAQKLIEHLGKDHSFDQLSPEEQSTFFWHKRTARRLYSQLSQIFKHHQLVPERHCLVGYKHAYVVNKLDRQTSEPGGDVILMFERTDDSQGKIYMLTTRLYNLRLDWDILSQSQQTEEYLEKICLSPS